MPEIPVQLPEKQPTLRLMTMPSDMNPNGDIFGGWVMSQVDIAGGVAAMRRARGRVTTVAVNAFQFKQPISIGDVVSFYTDIVKVGRTSITLSVEAQLFQAHHRQGDGGHPDLRGHRRQRQQAGSAARGLRAGVLPGRFASQTTIINRRQNDVEDFHEVVAVVGPGGSFRYRFRCRLPVAGTER